MTEPVSEWVDATVEPSVLPSDGVVVSRHFARALMTRPKEVFEAVTRVTRLGEELLTAEPPRGRSNRLDDEGLAIVGEWVGPGDVLVGKVSPGSDGQLRDASMRCPAWLEGVVVEATVEPSSAKTERARIRVVIEAERPLEVGDVLITDSGRQGVVCELADLSCDLAWSGCAGSIKVAKHRCAVDTLHARSIGPYSLVTQQPLGGRDAFGGQLLSRAQVEALAGAGATWALTELMTIKSDCVVGRMRAYESLVRQEDPDPFVVRDDLYGSASAGHLFEDDQADTPLSSLPTAALVLQAELAALGLWVTLGRSEVGVELLHGDLLESWSRGVVDRPETLNYRTLRPENGGLMCERIFGPTQDYRCACGRVEGRASRDTICPQCQVECGPSSVRRHRFGHVRLAAPVVHPLLLPPVALLLELSEADVRDVATARCVLRDGELGPAEDASFAETGGSALAAALAELDLEAIEATEAGPRADLAEAMFEQGIRPADLMIELLPVLPPDLRPLVPLDDGRFATSDLNDLYRRAINRNNRLRRLLELDAPAIILLNEARHLFEAIEDLFDNGRRGQPVTGPNRRPLVSLLDKVDVGRGDCVLAKRVDYSGQATLVVEPDLSPGVCLVPMVMARELFRPMAYGRMEAQGHVSTIKEAKRALNEEADFALDAVEQVADGAVALLMAGDTVIAREVALWHRPAIAVDRITAERLGLGAVVSIHIPLTERARAECRTLPDAPAARPARPSGWLTEVLTGADLVPTLREAMLRGHTDPIDDPLMRAVLGRRP